MDLDAVGLAYHLRRSSDWTNNPDNTGYQIYTVMKEELFKVAILGCTHHTFNVGILTVSTRNKVADLFKIEGLKVNTFSTKLEVSWRESDET